MPIDLTKLKAKNIILPDGKTTLADGVALLEKGAERRNARAGLQRLAVVSENFNQLSIEEAYRLLDPEAFQREVEDAQPYKVLSKGLSVARIGLSLLPLIVTWFSMSFAVMGYQHYLDVHQKDPGVPPPFLKLWQDGFPGDPLTFSLTGFIDFGLLSLFLVFSIWALTLEYKGRSNSERFATELRKVTQGLMSLIATDGLTRMTSDTEIEKVGRIIQAAIGHAYQSSQQIMQQSMELFKNQITPLLKTFDNQVAVLHVDLDRLTQNLQTYQQQVSALTTASQDVAQASTQLTASASTLVTVAGNQTAAAQDISREVAALNNTQQNMIPSFESAQQRVAGMFTTTQQRVVAEIHNAAGSMSGAANTVAGVAGAMKDAAIDVRNVGQQLTMINPQNVKIVVDRASDVATELQNAAQAISTATGNATPKGSRKAPRRGMRRLWPF